MSIISLLIRGADNKEISKELKIPLPTIQRRTRNLFERKIVSDKVELNYRELGICRGLMHVYLRDGDTIDIARKLSQIDGMISVAIHVGNSDIVSEIAYNNSPSILKMICEIKKIPGVDRIVWSEEVYSMPSNRSISDLIDS